jgi:hypothetical protein
MRLDLALFWDTGCASVSFAVNFIAGDFQRGGSVNVEKGVFLRESKMSLSYSSFAEGQTPIPHSPTR